MNDVFLEVEQEKERPLTVVRLLTTHWWDGKGLHIKRSLIVLRRRSKGPCLLEEDVSVVGAKDTAAMIENLDESKDGIYKVVVCNVSRDWETGYMEDWGYRLLPFAEEITE